MRDHLGSNLCNKSLEFTKAGDDLEANELRDIPGGVLGDGLCHGPEGGIINSCDQEHFLMLGLGHWFYYFEGPI